MSKIDDIERLIIACHKIRKGYYLVHAHSWPDKEMPPSTMLLLFFDGVLDSPFHRLNVENLSEVNDYRRLKPEIRACVRSRIRDRNRMLKNHIKETVRAIIADVLAISPRLGVSTHPQISDWLTSERFWNVNLNLDLLEFVRQQVAEMYRCYQGMSDDLDRVANLLDWDNIPEMPRHPRTLTANDRNPRTNAEAELMDPTNGEIGKKRCQKKGNTMTVTEAADFIGVTPSRVSQLCKSGEIKSDGKGKKRRVSRDSAMDYRQIILNQKDIVNGRAARADAADVKRDKIRLNR